MVTNYITIISIFVLIKISHNIKIVCLNGEFYILLEQKPTKPSIVEPQPEVNLRYKVKRL